MAGDTMTLLDYAASQHENWLLNAFVNAMMDDESPGGGMALIGLFPIMGIDSLSGVYSKITNEGSTTPTSRPIGGTYNSGIASLVTDSFNVGVFGQDVILDLAFLKKPKNYIQGATPETLQTLYLAKRMNRLINNYLMNGNKATDPNGFNGIRLLTDSAQVLNVSSDIPNGGSYTNGLNIYSTYTAQKGRDFLTAVDYLLDSVGGEGALIMNNRAKRAFFTALRDSSTSGNSFFKTTEDSYARKLETYREFEIIDPGTNVAVETLQAAITNANMVLPNNFTYGTATNATEIYAVRKGQEDGCSMLEYSPLDVRTVSNELPQGPAKLIRADWYPGFARFKKMAIAKLAGVVAV